MVNDRVNCNEVYYFLDIQLPYKLTTFFVCCSSFLWKNVLPVEAWRGDLLRVKCHAQEINKNFKIDVIWRIMCIFVA